ncbi:hypothetical protein BRAO375_4770007 [Bradyrhizobium sp. ORS 375]|nr:hypothetical protein BRAO375_4770007 [Bradyrhizobium sp. ORS 375]
MRGSTVNRLHTTIASRLSTSPRHAKKPRSDNPQSERSLTASGVTTAAIPAAVLRICRLTLLSALPASRMSGRAATSSDCTTRSTSSSEGTMADLHVLKMIVHPGQSLRRFCTVTRSRVCPVEGTLPCKTKVMSDPLQVMSCANCVRLRVGNLSNVYVIDASDSIENYGFLCRLLSRRRRPQYSTDGVSYSGGGCEHREAVENGAGGTCRWSRYA